MVIVKFPDGRDWFKANWVFRRLKHEMMAAAPDDAELKCALEEGEALGALYIDQMDSSLRSRTLLAMQNAVANTAKNAPTLLRAHPDDTALREYITSISELSQMIVGMEQVKPR